MDSRRFIRDGVKWIHVPSGRSRTACKADGCWSYPKSHGFCRQHYIEYIEYTESMKVAEEVKANATPENVKILESLRTTENVWITDAMFVYRGIKYKYSTAARRECCIIEGCENFSQRSSLCALHLSESTPHDSSIKLVVSNDKKYRVAPSGLQYLACSVEGCNNYYTAFVNQNPLCIRHGACQNLKVKCSEINCNNSVKGGAAGKCHSHSSEEYKEKRRLYVRYKYATDINFRLASLLRTRIRDALNGNFKCVEV